MMDKLEVKELIVKPQLEQFRIISDEVVLIDGRNEITRDKRIYAGLSVLEFSKVIMYETHSRLCQPFWF